MENRIEVVGGAVAVQNASAAVSLLRRRLARGLWVAPAVVAVSLPVHAQTSEVSDSSVDDELPTPSAKIGFSRRFGLQTSCGIKGGTMTDCQKTSCISALNEGEEPFTITRIVIENSNEFVLDHGALPAVLQPGDEFEICHQFMVPYTGPADDIPRDDEVTVMLSDGTSVIAEGISDVRAEEEEGGVVRP